MRTLDAFDFDSRPSRSRYKEVVKMLTDGTAKVVVLERGDAYFLENVKAETVQASVSAAIRNAGKRPNTRIIEDGNAVVVGINEKPARTRSNGRKQAVPLWA